MESRPGAAKEVDRERFAWRFRTAVCCLALVVLAFLQDPGRIVSDTKIDLSVDPGSFLSRALSLWDPIGNSGQVQNQAYGYLFPMGPFFWLGDLLSFEPWVVQRLWWALVFIVAFLGFAKLVKELGIGVPWTHLVGGFAYALSPRVLSIIGPASIEVWPAAIAPWVLVPLVIGMKRHSPWAMAASSALAVAAVGGVNAAATFAVIPLGVIWLIMADPGPRRRAMMITWPVFVLMATMWWLIPLFVLGKFSPPFLDYIESASLTTFAASLLNAVEGTTNWTAYLSDSSVAGRLIVSNATMLLNIAVVTALGIVGMVRRDNPRRAFLFMSMLVGVALVTLGHTASRGGLGALELQAFLDGVLAPLRNTHKFDGLIRLPLIVGFVHLLTVLTTEFVDSERARRRLTPGLGVAVLALAGLVGTTMPAWTAQLPSRGSFVEVPRYWKQTSEWLARNGGEHRALLVPASSFGTYEWGTTNDDPMQPLAKSPWSVRNAIPLGQPGFIRSLDAIESRFSDARGSEGLVRYLSATGVGYLVVRNDLRGSADGLDPEIVYETIAEMPQLEQVAAFGPTVGGKPRIENDKKEPVFIDNGWQSRHRAVEIYKVGNTPPLRAQSSSSIPVVIGSPETQLSLLEARKLESPAVLFAQDADQDSAPQELVLTDGQRRQEAAFGRAHDNRSSSLGATDKYVADRPVHDYSLSRGNRWLSVPLLQGARSITASSSRAWVNTTSAIDQSSQPWSAFDADQMTSWTASSADTGRRSWIQIDFDNPITLRDATVTVNRDPVETTRLSIESDKEHATVNARGNDPTTLRGISKPTSSLRISAPSTDKKVLSISDISIPGVNLARPLRLPAPAPAWGSPDRILLTADTNYRSGCLTVEGYLRCASGKDGWGEDGRTIDRLFTLPSRHDYPLELTVEPIGGTAFDELIQQGQLVTLEASSQTVRSPRASVLNASDGNDKTAWVAAANDERPRLNVNWVGEQSISRIKVGLDPLTAASQPTQVTLVFSDGSRRTVILSASGVGHFEPVDASGVEIRFDKVRAAHNLNSDGSGEDLAVGVSELTIGDEDLLPRPITGRSRTFRCGTGPSIQIDGKTLKTSVSATPGELLEGKRLPAAVCGEDVATLNSGSHRVRVEGSETFRPVRLSLGGKPVRAAQPSPISRGEWGKATRKAFLPDGTGGSTLVVSENFNTGWTEDSGKALPVMINGWQQGWQFNEDAGRRVDFEFAPNATYRAGLLAGAISLVALLVLTFVLTPHGLTMAVARPRRRRMAWSVGMLVTVAVLALVGGLMGTVIGLLGMGIAEFARRWVSAASLAGSVVAGVAVAAAVRPWAGPQTWLGNLELPQMVMALALGLMAGSVFGRPKRFRVFVGRSTNR